VFCIEAPLIATPCVFIKDIGEAMKREEARSSKAQNDWPVCRSTETAKYFCVHFALHLQGTTAIMADFECKSSIRLAPSIICGTGIVLAMNNMTAI
jgi:hypothetical protein